jgi:chromosomal replication initiation ATPase DnaA
MMLSMKGGTAELAAYLGVLECEVCNAMSRSETDAMKPGVSPEILTNRLASEIAQMRGVPAREIMSRNRSLRAAWARQELMYKLVRVYGFSHSRVGRILGRDHSSVINGVRAHADRAKREART